MDHDHEDFHDDEQEEENLPQENPLLKTKVYQRNPHIECWMPPSPFSNVHFRNTTKLVQHRFFTLNFLLILL